MPSPQVESLLDMLTNASVQIVEKPWGQEFIITAGDVVFKVIYVIEGERTSLQHHEQKDEVIFVLMGDGRIDYIESDEAERPSRGRRVRPGTIHRSRGELVLFEVSTNHPDDVVRHSDDYGRGLL